MALKDEIINDIKQFFTDLRVIFRGSLSKADIEKRIRDYYTFDGRMLKPSNNEYLLPQSMSANELHSKLFSFAISENSTRYVTFTKFYTVLLDMKKRGILITEESKDGKLPLLWNYNYYASGAGK